MFLVKKLSMSVLALAFMSSVSLGGEISGTVTGKDGKPAASVPVKLMKAAPGGPKKPAAAADDKAAADKPAAGEKKPAATPLKETTTSADGAFKFDGVEDGAYRVQAGNKDAGMGGAQVKVAAGKADPVSITLKEPKPKAAK